MSVACEDSTRLDCMGRLGRIENDIAVFGDTLSRIDIALRGDGNGEPGYSIRLDRVERAIAVIQEERKSKTNKQFTLLQGVLLVVAAEVIKLLVANLG